MLKWLATSPIAVDARRADNADLSETVNDVDGGVVVGNNDVVTICLKADAGLHTLPRRLMLLLLPPGGGSTSKPEPRRVFAVNGE